jgi:hypothetical protein
MQQSPVRAEAQGAGRIVTDVTVLWDEGHLEITYPRANSAAKSAKSAKPHYKIEYDLMVIVEGRNLRYAARWPARDDHEQIWKRKRAGKSSYMTLETAQVSIASAFKPGTG